MIAGKRILIIETDHKFRDLLCEQIAALGGTYCDGAQSGADAITLIDDAHFDLILLDAGVPEGGADMCRRLRDAGVRAPVMVLAAGDDEEQAIACLDSGGTDYVTRPFKLGVLLARIRAQIRQFEHSDDAVLTIADYAFRPGAKTLVAAKNDGEQTPVRLTDKEAQILKFLYMRAHGERGQGAVVSREELLNEVWGYNAGVTTHTLETHVYRLRQKMERDPSHAEILVTQPGGYQLIS